MKVACLQPWIFQDRTRCYLEIEQNLIDLLKKCNKCDIVCLPERWTPFFKDTSKNFQRERGNDYHFIKKLAENYNIKIISGAIWEKRINLKKPVINHTRV